jgi:hypothetical protein
MPDFWDYRAVRVLELVVAFLAITTALVTGW